MADSTRATSPENYHTLSAKYTIALSPCKHLHSLTELLDLYDRHQASTHTDNNWLQCKLKYEIYENLNQFKQMVKTYFLHHFAIPEGIWHTIHSLHEIAIACRCLNDDIDNCYKHIILLATCDPYAYTSDQIEVIDHIIGKVSSLSKICAHKKKKNTFTIDTDSDSGPSRTFTFEREHVLLDLNLDDISKAIKKIGKLDNDIDQSLIFSIIESWHKQARDCEDKPIDLSACVLIAGASKIKNEHFNWHIHLLNQTSCHLSTANDVPSHIEPGHPIWFMYMEDDHISERCGIIHRVYYENYGRIQLEVDLKVDEGIIAPHNKVSALQDYLKE